MKRAEVIKLVPNEEHNNGLENGVKEKYDYQTCMDFLNRLNILLTTLQVEERSVVDVYPWVSDGLDSLDSYLRRLKAQRDEAHDSLRPYQDYVQSLRWGMGLY
jgi:hypothetical protein